MRQHKSHALLLIDVLRAAHGRAEGWAQIVEAGRRVADDNIRKAITIETDEDQLSAISALVQLRAGYLSEGKKLRKAIKNAVDGGVAPERIAVATEMSREHVEAIGPTRDPS